MEPQNIRFGGGSADTILHPLVALWMLIAVVLILFLPRKYVIAPWLLCIFCTPLGQVIVTAGVHFPAARIVVLVGLLRLAISKGHLAGGFNSIDRVFTLLACSSLVVFSLEWMETQALIKSLGALVDTLGGYFVLRFLIQNTGDMRRAVKVLAAIAVIMAICMVGEQFTHQNIFGFLGGIQSVPAERNGQIRSQGAFEVYVTAGAFGATLLPLLVWLWTDGRSRVAAVTGAIGALLMAITSNTSTSLMASVAGIVGLCFWPLRARMRTIRWCLVILLVSLHLVMKAPVWALIARIDLTGSSSGYHRFMLVDNCIRHFWDWWLLGYKNYNDWGWDMWDLSNQYVAYAVTGGLVCLILFILVISRSFGRLGDARKSIAGSRKKEWTLWCVGSALLAHVMAYFGIGYFDQVQFAWYALLAIASVAVLETKRSRPPKPKDLLDAHSVDLTPVAIA